MAIVKYDREGRKSSYGVKWSLDGKRKFKFFENKTLRNDFFTKLVKKEKSSGRAILGIASHEAVIMQRCMDILGTPEKVLEACRIHSKRATLTDITSKEAIDEYLKEKKALGRDTNYHRAIRNILHRLRARFPASFAEWSEIVARAWVFELVADFSPVTVRNHIKASSAFCNWTVERKYIRENIFAKIQIPDVILPEPGFLKVPEIKKLLQTAREKYPSAVAYIALGAFAGIRSSASARLDLSALDFKKRGILIRADQAKNKRRVYLDGYEPNLWLWLEWAKKNAPRGFTLTKRQWDSMRGKVAESAGVKMPKNAFRHSFCTYHVALYGDAGKTATLLTHRGNVSILYEHYRGNAGKEQAKEYFNIKPK